LPKRKPKRKPKISSKTRWAIRTYVKQGISANKIQKKLQSQGLGIRRKVLLAEVRKLRGKKKKLHPEKYIRGDYRKRVTPKARRPKYAGRHVAVYRYARTLKHRRPYSARFEFYGSGKDLGKAVRLALSGIVPKWENPFVECSARAFLNNPYKYGERGEWVGKPNIES